MAEELAWKWWATAQLYLLNDDVFNIGIAIGLVLFAGFASGMTVGLLSVDPIQLRMLEEEGTAKEKKDAKRLFSVVSKHHLLLVTLLLANSISMEALPIFLDRSVPAWLAVALSVTAILLFGEIMPQALCTGAYQIPIVMKCLPFVKLLMFALYPISWPIAKFLDALLGHSSQTFYARSHLKTLIRLHQREKRLEMLKDEDHGTHQKKQKNSHQRQVEDHQYDEELQSALGIDEVNVIQGALDLATKTAGQIMVHIDRVYMLEGSRTVDKELCEELLKVGHSRIPVYEKHRCNLKGTLLVKNLIAAQYRKNPKIIDFVAGARNVPFFVRPDANLYDLLNAFQRGQHIAFITQQPEFYQMMFNNMNLKDGSGPEIPAILLPQFRLDGICTLEDVIEELIQEEIYDEFDTALNFYNEAAIKTNKSVFLNASVAQKPLRSRNGTIDSTSLPTPCSMTEAKPQRVIRKSKTTVDENMLTIKADHPLFDRTGSGSSTEDFRNEKEKEKENNKISKSILLPPVITMLNGKAGGMTPTEKQKYPLSNFGPLSSNDMGRPLLQSRDYSSEGDNAIVDISNLRSKGLAFQLRMKSHQYLSSHLDQKSPMANFVCTPQRVPKKISEEPNPIMLSESKPLSAIASGDDRLTSLTGDDENRQEEFLTGSDYSETKKGTIRNEEGGPHAAEGDDLIVFTNDTSGAHTMV